MKKCKNFLFQFFAIIMFVTVQFLYESILNVFLIFIFINLVRYNSGFVLPMLWRVVLSWPPMVMTMYVWWLEKQQHPPLHGLLFPPTKNVKKNYHEFNYFTWCQWAILLLALFHLFYNYIFSTFIYCHNYYVYKNEIQGTDFLCISNRLHLNYVISYYLFIRFILANCAIDIKYHWL